MHFNNFVQLLNINENTLHFARLISPLNSHHFVLGLGQFRPATHCEIQRQGPSPEWAKPKCNPDGSYKVYQCDAYTRTTCWCVYENGQMIPGKDPIK